MNAVYPRKRIESVLRPLHFNRAYRILLNAYRAEPLSAQRRRSRFGDGVSFAVLYAALTFETAFVEVLIRDRFVKRGTRHIDFDEIRERSWIELSLIGRDPLCVVDLRDDGCLRLGAPSDAVHARNQSAGRSLARALYTQSDIDGILFNSRLTGGDNLALFDRALMRVAASHVGELEHHPELPAVLKMHQISIDPWQPNRLGSTFRRD